jgi:hypothetical protein
MKDIVLTFANDRVAGVVATLGTDYDIGLLREEVDDFSFSFIAPLGANHYSVRHEY